MSAVADLTREGDKAREYCCSALGGFYTFTLAASNLWYLILAVDLVKAIRNPFRYVELVSKVFLLLLSPPPSLPPSLPPTL